MDRTNHKVTIPYSDYEELIKAKDSKDALRQNVIEHFKLLTKSGVSFDAAIDIDKKPTHATVSPSIGAGSVVSIYFKY